MKIKTIYIKGMTCVSCESIIKEEVSKLPGIKKVWVSVKKGQADIEYDERMDFDLIKDKIDSLGYSASFDKNSKTSACVNKKEKVTGTQWFYSLLIVLGFFLGYKLLQGLGLFNWVDVDPSNISYSVAILVGIVASMSTCLAVVGAVVISFGAKYESKGTKFEKSVKPHLLFHLGRIVTFFVLGGVLGLLGNWLNVSTSFISVFTIIIAIVLAWLGLNILGVTPSMTKYGIRMPKSIMKYWDRVNSSNNSYSPLILGGLTFFLPCGFTQSMQFFAVTTGSFWQGGLTLVMFAIGTLPILLLLGITTSKLKNMKFVVLKKAIGFVVILFAVYTMFTGLALAGLNINFFSGSGVESEISANEQIIRMNVDYSGFTPNVFNVKKGIPVKWIINGKKLTGCTNEIIIPSLGIKKKLIPGENVLIFTPTRAGTLNFSCWMGMVRGKFIVSDDKVSSAFTPQAAIASTGVDLNLGSTCGSSCDGSCGGGCGSSSCGN
jgi:uncharacterized protein